MQWHGQRAVVTLPEEIDISNSAMIQDELISVLGKRPAALIVDMTPTTYCDSAGVRAVMLAYRQAASSGCELRLVISAAPVMRVFSLLGADRLIRIDAGLADALGHSSDPGK